MQGQPARSICRAFSCCPILVVAETPSTATETCTLLHDDNRRDCGCVVGQSGSLLRICR